MVSDLWESFNYAEIRREAVQRLAQAKSIPDKLTPETDTLEYWIAWCAHANCAACLGETIDHLRGNLHMMSDY